MRTNEHAAKRPYNEVLRAKLADFVMEHGVEMSDDCFETLFATVKDESLRSFKNGLAASRKRPAGNRPSRQEA
jgi:hypothetical protein